MVEMFEIQPALVERFLRYVKVETTSDEKSETYPSTPTQHALLDLLVDELKALGASDVRKDAHSYVLARIPSNLPAGRAARVPAIGFLAHVDTSPDVSGKDVKPQIVEGYDGGFIPLRGTPDLRLDPAEQTDLAKVVGHTIITTDGTTLLGADDKAGVAEIMTAAAWLLAHPELPHGDVLIAFTPDEEIGRGTKFFDVKGFGAEFAYTLDGSGAGCVEFETFSADAANVIIDGRSEHPGTAKGKMVSAIKLAADFLDRLPKSELCPECTSGREGFVHPTRIDGTVQQTVIQFILRDFETAKLAEQKILLERIAAEVLAGEPRARIRVETSESYRNMREGLEKVPFVVSYAEDAIRKLGVEPWFEAVRGGTDGSRLTAMGLPTPNLFTGGHNYHSRYEWASVQEMVLATRMIVELVQIWAERGVPGR